MIAAAVVLSALVGHWADFLIVLVPLLMNAVVGFWEESQATSTIAALNARLALQAQTMRASTRHPPHVLVPAIACIEERRSSRHYTRYLVEVNDSGKQVT